MATILSIQSFMESDMMVEFVNFLKLIMHNFGLSVIVFIIANIAINIAVRLDKKTGIARAKREGRPIVSSKKRKSVVKKNQYLVDLYMAFVLDVFIMLVEWVLCGYIFKLGWIPLLPIVSMWTAFTDVRIEQLSMRENMTAEYKDSKEAAIGDIKEDLADITSLLLKKPELVKEILNVIKKLK